MIDDGCVLADHDVVQLHAARVLAPGATTLSWVVTVWTRRPGSDRTQAHDAPGATFEQALAQVLERVVRGRTA